MATRGPPGQGGLRLGVRGSPPARGGGGGGGGGVHVKWSLNVNVSESVAGTRFFFSSHLLLTYRAAIYLAYTVYPVLPENTRHIRHADSDEDRNPGSHPTQRIGLRILLKLRIYICGHFSMKKHTVRVPNPTEELRKRPLPIQKSPAFFPAPPAAYRSGHALATL